MRLTKIVVTVGPAIEDEKILCEILEEGNGIFRFNLKHSNLDWHKKFLNLLKRCSKKTKKEFTTIFDLPDSNLKTLKKFFPLIKKDADFLAISLIKSAKEIERIKKIKINSKIIAKIETNKALDNFEEILKISEAIIVARGDLANYVPLEKIPYYQKKIIKRCLEEGKPVIVATQMLKSMTEYPSPTRAEISDIANAILDYTDAVMLSEETAIGKYPLKAVKVMSKVVEFWEKERPEVLGVNFKIDHQAKAVCFSAYQLWKSEFCQEGKIKAFLVLTKGGLTVQMLSRLRPKIPIIAVTNDRFLAKRLILVFGVFPFYMKGEIYKKRGPKDIKKLLNLAKDYKFAKKGEKIIIIYNEDWKTFGKTSILRIQEII